MNGRNEMEDDDLIAIARQKYAMGDDLEIDDKPVVSRGDDGAWVQAWVWVPYPEQEEEEDEEV